MTVATGVSEPLPLRSTATSTGPGSEEVSVTSFTLVTTAVAALNRATLTRFSLLGRCMTVGVSRVVQSG